MKLATLLDHKSLVTTLIGGAILGALGWFWDLFSWTSVTAKIAWIGEYLTARIEINRWMVWGIVIYALVLSAAWLIALRNNLRRPGFESYRKDNFLGLQWRWRYYENDIVGICAFCPQCKLQLRQQEGHSLQGDWIRFECYDGHGTWRFEKTSVEIEREIAIRIQQRINLARERGVTPSSLSADV